MELTGRWVRFAIRDIYMPTPEVVLKELHEDDVIAGQVVDVSDSGIGEEGFVVVRVEKVKELVVVPLAQIRDRC
jgi:hypothetical protein